MTFSVLNYHAKYLFPFLWDVHFFLPSRNCFSLSDLLLDNSTIVPLSLERFRVTFTAKGKREFVPRDQVFPLLFSECSLLLQENRIDLGCFYLLIFYFGKF